MTRPDPRRNNVNETPADPHAASVLLASELIEAFLTLGDEGQLEVLYELQQSSPAVCSAVLAAVSSSLSPLVSQWAGRVNQLVWQRAVATTLRDGGDDAFIAALEVGRKARSRF